MILIKILLGVAAILFAFFSGMAYIIYASNNYSSKVTNCVYRIYVIISKYTRKSTRESRLDGKIIEDYYA